MIVLWTSFLALGADLSSFPLQAPISLCEGCDGRGAYRFDVPLPLREGEWSGGRGGLSLVDAEGRAVPVAWIRGDARAREVAAVRLVDLGRFVIGAPDREADGLDLAISGGDVLRVSLLRVEGGTEETPVGAPVVVATENGQAAVSFRFPPTRASLRVRVEALQGPVPTEVEAYHRFDAAAFAEPARLVLPVGPAQPGEYADTLHPLVFDGALPFGQLSLFADVAVYDRPAHLVGARLGSGESVTGGYGRLRRVAVGGAEVASGALSTRELGPVAELAVAVSPMDGPPLPLREATLEVEGLRGLVLDPGPGPFTLYAGAPDHAIEPSELAVAAPELARLATRALGVGEVAPNPTWSPPERVAGLVGPGEILDFRRMRWVHPLAGEGLVRAALPVEVLAQARPDLGDLRLIDAEGRELPFLLARRLAETTLDTPAPERVEAGGNSRISVKLPAPGLKLARVTLETEATAFRRSVVVERPVGRRLEVVRASEWRSSGKPARLDLALDGERFGDTLVLRIDNGDNPPLPVGKVTVTGEAWDLLADLPAGGARLVYGDGRLGRPDYDLALLDADVGLRARARATVGPGATLAAPPVPMWDKAVIYAGLAALVAGLLALLAVLLRAPAPPEPAAPATE